MSVVVFLRYELDSLADDILVQEGLTVGFINFISLADQIMFIP